MAIPHDGVARPGGELILRFDDISPGMAWSKFLPLKKAVSALGIHSVLGVVPDCRDPGLQIEPDRADFFNMVREWCGLGDTIAQHGTYHLYDSNQAGLLGLQKRSEFAGHLYSVQRARLALGKEILSNEGVWHPYFMAPSHSFDLNTLSALHNLGFIAITDGFGFYPYRVNEMLLVPQLTGRPLGVGIGIQTLCVHINSMDETAIKNLLEFVTKNVKKFVDFKHVAARPVHDKLVPVLLRTVSAYGIKAVRGLRDPFRATSKV